MHYSIYPLFISSIISACYCPSSGGITVYIYIYIYIYIQQLVRVIRIYQDARSAKHKKREFLLEIRWMRMRSFYGQ
jgi:hypothetical protein